MINIVLFGPPGAGKGTQAKMLSEKYGFNHISTGEVIRNEIQRGTELGLQVKEVIESGRLASDELVIGIIEEYLASHGDSKGNIFDGFPRTTHQAETFDVIMEKRSDKVDVMISLDVPDEELISRLLLRAEVSGRADDADEGVIRNRIDVYKAPDGRRRRPLCAAGQIYPHQRARHYRRGIRPPLRGYRQGSRERSQVKAMAYTTQGALRNFFSERLFVLSPQ